MSPFDFRTYQALTDLYRVHRFLGPDSVFPITQGNNALLEELTQFLREPSPSSGTQCSQTLRDALWMAAVSPEVHYNAFLTATSALIKNALANREYAQDLSWLWEDYSGHYRTSAPPVRAALMNGFERLRHHCLLPDDCRPSEEDLLTRDRTEAEEMLTPIARSMTPAEIECVAAADFGMDIEEHKSALFDLLNSPALAYPPNELRFPAEVIELVSHVQRHTGWLPSTAILLLDAVRTLDERSNAEFSFKRQWRGYSRLPAPARSAFHAAFRYLYEKNAFDPQFPNYHCFDRGNNVSLGWGG